MKPPPQASRATPGKQSGTPSRLMQTPPLGLSAARGTVVPPTAHLRDTRQRPPSLVGLLLQLPVVALAGPEHPKQALPGESRTFGLASVQVEDPFPGLRPAGQYQWRFWEAETFTAVLWFRCFCSPPP